MVLLFKRVNAKDLFTLESDKLMDPRIFLRAPRIFYAQSVLNYIISNCYKIGAARIYWVLSNSAKHQIRSISACDGCAIQLSTYLYFHENLPWRGGFSW